MTDQATFDRLRELAEAGKAGGWQEVSAALDMGDIILGLRDRGAVKAAQEATGMHRSTLWRRAKLSSHREVVERERPANLTEALRLVQRLEAEGGEGEGEPEKNKGGRPKRDPLAVLTERLKGTASLIAQQALMAEEDALAIVREAYAEVAGDAALKAELAADPGLEDAIVEAFKASAPKPPGKRGRPKPATPERFTAETQGTGREPVDGKLIDGPTQALVLMEGPRGWLGKSEAGLFTDLSLEDGWLSWTVRTRTGSKTVHCGHLLRHGCVLAAEGVEFPEAVPGGPGDGRVATPEEYRAHWEGMRGVLLAAGRRLLLDGVTAEMLAGYPDRVAAAAEAEADRLADIAAEDERKAELEAFAAAARVRLREPKGARATIVSADGGGRPCLQEVRVFELTYGPWRDGERAEYEYKSKGEPSRTSPHRWSEEWGPGKAAPFAILRGQRLGIVDMGEHGFSLDDTGLTWAEVAHKARGCGAEFLVDRLPANGGFPRETEAGR